MPNYKIIYFSNAKFYEIEVELVTILNNDVLIGQIVKLADYTTMADYTTRKTIGRDMQRIQK